MSNFYCPECGALCEDSPRGYITGCEHYLPDINKGGFPVKNKSYHRRQYRRKSKYAITKSNLTDQPIETGGGVMKKTMLKECPNTKCSLNSDCSFQCYTCGYNDCMTENTSATDPLLEKMAQAFEEMLNFEKIRPWDEVRIRYSHIQKAEQVLQEYREMTKPSDQVGIPV